VPLPDLNTYPLPDLAGPEYPTVHHAPAGGCVDAGYIEAKACWPFPALIRVRVFALPTEPLGALRHAFLRIRNLFPVPPSIGVHCPTVVAPSPTVQMIPGVAADASWTREVTQPASDACQIRWTDLLKLPCIIPAITGGPIKDSGAVVIGAIQVTQTGTGCGVGFVLGGVLNIAGGVGPTGPRGFTGPTGFSGPTGPGGRSAVGGLNFVITEMAQDWLTGLACSTCSFDFEEDIPVLVDVDGILVAAGSPIGSGAGFPGVNEAVTNGGRTPLLCGDRVALVLVAPGVTGPTGPGAPNQWKAYKT